MKIQMMKKTSWKTSQYRKESTSWFVFFLVCFILCFRLPFFFAEPATLSAIPRQALSAHSVPPAAPLPDPLPAIPRQAVSAIPLSNIGMFDFSSYIVMYMFFL